MMDDLMMRLRLVFERVVMVYFFGVLVEQQDILRFEFEQRESSHGKLFTHSEIY